jgi:hypothetical protein
VKIHHSYCEANMCANVLANLCCVIGPTMMFYEACPTQVSNFFTFGISFSHVVAV